MITSYFDTKRFIHSLFTLDIMILSNLKIYLSQSKAWCPELLATSKQKIEVHTTSPEEHALL